MKRILTSLLIFGSLASGFAQGSLTPPGAPAPTMKTLSQVEPRTPIETLPVGSQAKYQINQPGSYYLSSNLVLTTAQSAIGIGTNNVTIDLGGFTVFGSNGPCVRTTVGGLVGIRVHGGRVAGGSSGLDFGSFGSSTNCVFEDLEIVCAPGGAFRYGIRADARSAARRCSVVGASGSDSIGILLGNDSVVEDCLVLDSDQGMNVGLNTRIERCQVRNCTGSQGIFAQDGCVIRNNIVETCRGGIRAGSDSMITDNLVEYSVGNGAGFLITGGFNRIERNASHFNGTYGFATQPDTTNFLAQNIAHGNTNGNYSFNGSVIAGPTETTTGTVTNHPWANFSY